MLRASYRNIDIPATPAAPASTHDAAFSSVIPPSASTGIFTTSETLRNSSNPRGAKSDVFDKGANTGPNTT